eukprot:g9108.t1
MRPMPEKFEDTKDAPPVAQQKQQSPSNGAAAFSPTRRVGARGGPQLFAQKLFTLVEEEDSDIVEWLPDGLAFRVKDIHRFSCEVLEKYFNHSKFTSFQRQLNLYQFKRRKGAHAGAFHHPSFRRGQRHLLSKVRRQKVKRDLAVEARAAQRLARTKGGSNGGGCGGENAGRGRTRGAAQADLRPIRRRRQIEDDGDDDYASEEDDEFTASPGSRRSAMRRRVDSGPANHGGSGLGVRYTQDGNSDESSNDDVWVSESGGGSTSGQEQFSSGDDDERLEWGGGGGGGFNNWRQQVPGSPERSPRELRHVSTPMTMTSQSEYEHSPGTSTSIGSGGGDLARTSSVGSSMASSLSFTSSPSHSEMMLHSSSPYQFNDCDESGHSDSTSPMSIHSPVGQGETIVHDEAAAAAAAPSQQRQHDNDLSLAAVVDATVSGWGSPPPSSSLPHLEQFGWGAANLSVDAGAPWTDQPAHGMPQHHQSAHGSPNQEDFGFIDLFATNWDAAASSSSSSSSSSVDSAGMPSSAFSSSSSPPDGNDCGGGGNGADVNGNDAFLKEAQAAGVFGGVDDFLIPRGSGGAAAGGYGAPAECA